MPPSLDAIDQQIVALLVRDGRAGAAEISRALEGVSERSMRYGIERLLRKGVVHVGAVVDPRALGFRVLADVFIEVAPGEVDQVARRVVGKVVALIPGVLHTKTVLVPWKLKDVYE